MAMSTEMFYEISMAVIHMLSYVSVAWEFLRKSNY